MVPLTLMAAGTAIDIIGKFTQSWQKSIQEKANAEFYRKQARLAEQATMRQKKLAEFEYTHRIGEQMGSYAAGGVDISGSAANTVGGTVANLMNELYAIEEQGKLNAELARMRGHAAQQLADQLADPGFVLMQSATSLIGAYAASNGFGKGFPDWMTGASAGKAGGSDLFGGSLGSDSLTSTWKGLNLLGGD